MKLYIEKDERYPVYYLTEKSWFVDQPMVELTDEEYSDYNRHNELYDKSQDLLESKWKQMNEKRSNK